jgi:tRNA threonylcarbamoyladenosine biosynthesis protein TsaE
VTAVTDTAATNVTTELVGPDSARDVHALVIAAFGARQRLDPPSTALDETVSSVADALAAHGGVLAVLDGRPAGSVLLEPRGERLALRRVAVHPRAQGHGVATALVSAAEEVAAARGHTGVELAARTELPATIRFWEHHGYGEVEHHGTSVTMARELSFGLDLPTPDDTRSLGASLAGMLRAGDLLVLDGDLGAGKTTLTQGLGSALGVRGAVTSPTFVIARLHPAPAGRPALVHVDAFRLGDRAELDDLDLDASVADSVTVVEWGSGLAEALTDDRLEVALTRSHREDDERRRAVLTPVGARWVGSGLARRVLASGVS